RSLLAGSTPRKRYAVPAGMQRCTRCGRTLTASTEFFPASKQRKSGLYSHCHTCCTNKAKGWAANHPQKRNAWKRGFYAKNRTRILKEQREFRISHPEIASLRAQLCNGRRRARERQLPYAMGAHEWKRCIDYWEYRCAACGRSKGPGRKIAADH